MKQNTITRAKLRRMFRSFFTNTERKTKLYKRITSEYYDRLEFLVEQAEKMEAWCASKQKKPSLLRFGNWLKNSIKFQKEREIPEDLEFVERKRTHELLKHRDNEL